MNADGSYTPLATLNKTEWAELQKAPDSLGKRWGKQQITVNSEPRIIYRGAERKRKGRAASSGHPRTTQNIT